jgi:hypothetical protein
MRRNVSICWSSAKSMNSARDHDITIENTDSGRCPVPTRMWPNEPQSTWACSPGSVSTRR